MHRSKLVLGFVVALGVGGLGAAAVAMENNTGASVAVAADTTTTLAVDPSTTVPATVAPTTTVAPTAAPATDEPTGDPATTDPGVERSTDGCDGATYANHGDYVSDIARGADRQPGDVPAAAQSDCGKPLTSVGGDDGEKPVEAPEPEAPATGVGSDSGGPGKGKGASGK